MRKPLSQEIKNKIIELYPDHYSADIANMLGLKLHQVYNVAYDNKVKKSQEFRDKELAKQGERLKVIGYATGFKPNHKPYNKGQKMPSYVYEKIKFTFFKKGQTVYNEKFDGYERICS
jgi:hypothetical protein